jgi:mycothiol synthase
MLPPGVSTRPARRDDLDDVIALLIRWDLAEVGAPDTDPADVVSVWDTPGLDLARDTLLVVGPDRPVGYATLVGGREADTTVEPAWRGRGIEEELLAWAEARAREVAAGPVIEHWAAAGSPLAAVLERQGWDRVRTLFHLARDLADPPPEPRWPAGVGLRPFDPGRDGRSAHQVIETAFADVPGTHPTSYEEWVAANLARGDFDPALVLLAGQGERVVGVALTYDWGDRGWVRHLAVPRAERGRGIALALLHRAFAVHRERGLPRTALGVDADNAGGLRLYEKAGMRAYREFGRYDKPL